MRTVLLLCACAIYISCAHAGAWLKQSGVEIALLVRPETGVVTVYNDGGTKMIQIRDTRGRIFEVYFDHRIGDEVNSGCVYLNGYPGDSNSIRVVDQVDFKRTVLRGVKNPE